MPKSSRHKVSSPKMSTKAAKALTDGRTSALTKSLAGCVLAQSKGKKK